MGADAAQAAASSGSYGRPASAYAAPAAPAASTGAAAYHPALALAAAHSGSVLDRVINGLDPGIRSLAPKALALAHHENLPASILLGVAQADGLAHPKGLVNVARRLKAADFHGQPHIALGKVTSDVSKALNAAKALHALDHVPNPHDLIAPAKRHRQLRQRLTKVAARAASSGVPAGVPPQYRAAIAKYGRLVDPVAPKGMTGAQYLAGTIKFESGFNPSARNPSSGAAGLGQFMAGTAATFRSQYHVDPTGPPDQQIKAAAMHLSGRFGHPALYAGYNPGYGADPVPATARALGPLTGAKPIPRALKQRARQVLGRKTTRKIIRNQLSGGGTAGLPKGYVQPVTGGTQSRTDQGVDFSGAGAKIRAIGHARIVSLGGSGWPEGGGVVYQLTSGPRKGKYVYNYEGLTPTVKVGQKVRPGQQIASLTGSSIEIGWSDANGVPLGSPSNTGQALPANHWTKQGAHFAKFLGGAGSTPTTGSAALLGGTGAASALGGSVSSAGGAPSSRGGGGSGGGAGTLTAMLAALLPTAYRAGPKTGQAPTLAGMLSERGRPQRRLRTGR